MVSSADCFSVSDNETVDMSSAEQFCVGIRYVYKDEIKEDFPQFDQEMNVTSWGHSRNFIRMPLETWHLRRLPTIGE
jgi:hypothetical protein